MASWINHNLIITGEKELVEKFMKEAISTYPKPTLFSLESFIAPTEEQYRVLNQALSSNDKFTVKNANDVLAQWRVMNWGCKSDLSGVWSKVSYISKEATKDTYISVTYLFDTLYKPCITGLKGISAKNPNLSFSLTYYGFDDGIRGEAMIESGVITDQSETWIPYTEADLLYEEYNEYRQGIIERSYKELGLSSENKENASGVSGISGISGTNQKESIKESIETFSKSEADEILDFLN
jgi:hypothetical protein